MYATRNGRAPITVAPAVGWIRFGPKSGTRSGFVPISSRAFSNSPRRMSARFVRFGLEAARSYRNTGMPSSAPTRSPSARASATQSSIVAPSSGMNGQTSVAPMRGCSPLCAVRSIRSRAFAMPLKAACTACSRGAAKVTTVRLCDGSDETSSIATPGTAAMASRIAVMTSGRRPSEKFGTHSISFMRRNLSGSLNRSQQPRVHRRARPPRCSCAPPGTRHPRPS